MTIEFVERIREERKFDSLDRLVEEMHRDISERARDPQFQLIAGFGLSAEIL